MLSFATQPCVNNFFYPFTLVFMRKNIVFFFAIFVVFVPLPTEASSNTQLSNSQNPHHQTTVKEWEFLAAKGDPDAEYALGKIYYGKGTQKNYSIAQEWYRKAAEQGHIKAQYELGLMNDTGLHIPQNKEEAIFWYKKAAESGSASAQRALGVMYELGLGTQENFPEAIKWYRLAANLGDADAQYHLGFIFYHGRCVLRDSLSCLNPENVVEKDYLYALKWTRLSAAQGREFAQNLLGTMYANGKGVSENHIVAYSLFKLAVLNKYAGGQAEIEELKTQMSMKELDEANRLLFQFFRSRDLLSSLDYYLKHERRKAH
jgi:TPR repeat protein